jgi:membrane-associated phospholipid phosphatase
MSSNSAHFKTFLGNWALPIFVTRQNKYPMGLMLFLIASAFYMHSNHFHWVEPQLLTMSRIDTQIPFIPTTVWLYLSEYLLFVVVYVTCKDMVNLNKYFYSYFALQSVSVLIFYLWPTTYPRDLFPLPKDIDAVTYYIFNGMRMTDSPANCCPSLHVSSVYISVFIFLDDQKGKFPFFFLWGTAIAISTLTTKQHYLIDVVMGFFMAVITYWIFHKYISYKSLSPAGAQAKR